jgi:GGDEF domain-containing protein
LPIIITTAGPSGRPQRLNAYAAGAWEFYGQPLDSEALLHKLTIYLGTHDEARRLRRAALTDGVTGLYTELGLARRATELIADGRRIGRAVACVAWSLSEDTDPTRTNHVVTAFRACGRAADALGRLENGAFAVVAAGLDATGAGRLASRFQEALARAIDAPTDQVRTTIVIDDPGDLPSDGEQLLRQLGVAFAV